MVYFLCIFFFVCFVLFYFFIFCKNSALPVTRRAAVDSEAFVKGVPERLDLVHGPALTLRHTYLRKQGRRRDSVPGPVGWRRLNWPAVKWLTTLLLRVPVFKVKRGVFIFLQTRHCILDLCVLFRSVLLIFVVSFWIFFRLGSFLLWHKLTLFDFRKTYCRENVFSII